MRCCFAPTAFCLEIIVLSRIVSSTPHCLVLLTGSFDLLFTQYKHLAPDPPANERHKQFDIRKSAAHVSTAAANRSQLTPQRVLPFSLASSISSLRDKSRVSTAQLSTRPPSAALRPVRRRPETRVNDDPANSTTTTLLSPESPATCGCLGTHDSTSD